MLAHIISKCFLSIIWWANNLIFTWIIIIMISIFDWAVVTSSSSTRRTLTFIAKFMMANFALNMIASIDLKPIWFTLRTLYRLISNLLFRLHNTLRFPMISSMANKTKFFFTGSTIKISKLWRNNFIYCRTIRSWAKESMLV